MLVSIIITNFNYGRFLPQAIDSALNQTHPDTEVIVVDDGSTDDSAAVILNYGKRITAVLKANGGQCSGVNAGFARSHGEAVIFLDADDALMRHAVAVHVERLRDPRVVRSQGQLEVTDACLRPMGRLVPKTLAPSGDLREMAARFGPSRYRAGLTSANAWSRAFLEKVLPLPENDLIGADGYLTAVDLFFGRIASLPEPVGYYRRHGNNKGPMTVSADPDYLRSRVARVDHRLRYAAGWAARLGYDVDLSKWRRCIGWRRTLMAQLLRLTEGGREGPQLIELMASPFRRRPHRLLQSLLISASLALTTVLPKRQALRLGHALLSRGAEADMEGARPLRPARTAAPDCAPAADVSSVGDPLESVER